MPRGPCCLCSQQCLGQRSGSGASHPLCLSRCAVGVAMPCMWLFLPLSCVLFLVFVSLSLSLCLYLSLSNSISISLSLCVAVYLSIYPSVYLSVCLSTDLAIYPCVYLPMHTYICSCIYRYVRSHPSIDRSFDLSSTCHILIASTLYAVHINACQVSR